MNELHPVDLHVLGRMRPDLWVIPCDETRQLLSLCSDLERKGLCRIEQPEHHEDGRVRCTLTKAGYAALGSPPH